MEKYESFVKTFRELEETVNKMWQATTRQEIDELEMRTRKLIQTLGIKFPYVQADIHDHASRRRGDILVKDTEATLGTQD